jgi:hypothetical protein
MEALTGLLDIAVHTLYMVTVDTAHCSPKRAAAGRVGQPEKNSNTPHSAAPADAWVSGRVTRPAGCAQARLRPQRSSTHSLTERQVVEEVPVEDRVEELPGVEARACCGTRAWQLRPLHSSRHHSRCPHRTSPTARDVPLPAAV